jgi:hypothetical protein
MALINPYHDLYRRLSDEPPELQLALRKKLIWAYSWAIPNGEAILAIAERSPLIEIGAGTGYWAWILKQAGADVIAFDSDPLQPPHWIDVQHGSSRTVADHPDRTLFLCWPPYESSMASEALESFTGSRLVYVGEWGGRTADAGFHEALSSRWTVTRSVKIPSWPGFRDEVYF